MLRNCWSRSAATAVAGLTLVAVACAAILNQNATMSIPSIDTNGNPTMTMPGVGAGKIYKETTTGILVGVFAGAVRNASQRAVTIPTQGLTMHDPFANVDVVSSYDQETVATPQRGFSSVSLILLYVPNMNTSSAH